MLAFSSLYLIFFRPFGQMKIHSIIAILNLFFPLKYRDSVASVATESQNLLNF